MGSGYGTALAREVVGPEGLVVAVEIDPATLAFARENLRQAGYNDVVLVHDDRGLGYSEQAPYDRICVTAACPRVPPPLIDQLAPSGRLIAPILGLSPTHCSSSRSANRGCRCAEIRHPDRRGPRDAAPDVPA